MSWSNNKDAMRAIKEGEQAQAGSACPYGMSEIGLRCAWLAGHHDTHGLEAWEKAR